MKRVLLTLTILSILCITAQAQILLDWTEITAGLGVFFKTDTTLIQPAQPDNLTYWLSLAASNRVTGTVALHQALLQLRALHPEEFDQVFADNHLTIALPQ